MLEGLNSMHSAKSQLLVGLPAERLEWDMQMLEQLVQC